MRSRSQVPGIGMESRPFEGPLFNPLRAAVAASYDMVREVEPSLLKGHGSRDLDTVRSKWRDLGKGQREERVQGP